MLKSKNESTLFFSSYLVAKSESWSQAFLSPVFGLQEVSKYFVNTWTHALLKILARFISKHTSLLKNLFSDIIQEYFPSKFRLLFHIKNYQNKTNQCRVMVQQYFIEEKAPFTWLILTTIALQGAFELGPLLFPNPATTLTNRLLYCILRLARPVFFFFFSCLSTFVKGRNHVYVPKANSFFHGLPAAS